MCVCILYATRSTKQFGREQKFINGTIPMTSLFGSGTFVTKVSEYTIQPVWRRWILSININITKTFAKSFTNITTENENIIMHARKLLLFVRDSFWIKKTSDTNFDVTMGSFDVAELSEFVGLFVLNKLENLYGMETSGFYRDGGLCCFHKISRSESEWF